MGKFVERFMDPKRSLAMGIPFLILGIIFLAALWPFLMGDPENIDDGVVKYKGTVEKVNTDYDRGTELKIGKYYFFVDTKTDDYRVGTSVVIWRVDRFNSKQARETLWSRDSPEYINWQDNNKSVDGGGAEFFFINSLSIQNTIWFDIGIWFLVLFGGARVAIGIYSIKKKKKKEEEGIGAAETKEERAAARRKKFVEEQGGPTMEELKAAGSAFSAEGDVRIDRTIDFKDGLIMLNIAVVNEGVTTFVNGSFETQYDEELLRLERLEPYSGIADKNVFLDILEMGKKKEFAYLFAPRACVPTEIEGKYAYVDSYEESQSLEMTPIKVEMISPIIQEGDYMDADMLRSLLATKFKNSGSRVYTIPPEILPEKMFELCKEFSHRLNITYVDEFETDTPAFEAEVWYYGEVGDEKEEFVLMLVVRSPTRSVEISMRCPDNKMLTYGLVRVADAFNKNLIDREVVEEPLEAVIFPEIRERILQRQLLIKQMEDDLI